MRNVAIVALAILGLGSYLPTPIQAGLEATVVAIVLLFWLGPLRRRQAMLLATTTAAGLWWAVNMFHSNVPDIATGLLGWRQSVLMLFAFTLGHLLFASCWKRLERDLLIILCFSVSLSILIHLLVPEIEVSVARTADLYTSTFAGSARLQGLYAGPFHAAFAGCILLTSGLLYLRRSPVFGSMSALIGTVAIHLAAVRTAFVALLLVAGVLFLKRTGLSGKLRYGFAASVTVLILALGTANFFQARNPALESLTSIAHDSRFENRFPGWSKGVDMFMRAPLVGNGTASAGDTLGWRFHDGQEHLTSHNFLLAWAVEGGLIGLVLIFGVLATVGWAIIRSRCADSRPAQATLVIFIGFGLTGAIMGAHPVALYAGVLMGATAGHLREHATGTPAHCSGWSAPPARSGVTSLHQRQNAAATGGGPDEGGSKNT